MSQDSPASNVFQGVSAQFDNLCRTRRAIVAIYGEDETPPNQLHQCGTGFIVDDGDRAFLVTARHTLYGVSGKEDPYSKGLFWNGSLQTLYQIRIGGNGLVDG